MILHWLGIALLAGSWLLGLKFYQPPDTIGWLICILGGVALLSIGQRRSAREEDSASWRPIVAAVASLALLVPALLAGGMPYIAIPVLLMAGALLGAIPKAPRALHAAGSGMALAGGIMAAQALAMFLYEVLTARSHELPWPLPHAIGAAAWMLNIDVGVTPSAISVGSMRKVFPLAPSCELLLDPATLCFIVGAIALLLAVDGRRWRNLGVLLLAVVLWLPLRAALLLGLFLHRVLITDYDEKFNVMNQFFDPWLHLALLAVPALFAWRLLRVQTRRIAKESRPATPWRLLLSPALGMVAAFLFTFGFFYDPIGGRKTGKVLFDEIHGVKQADGTITTWEDTRKAMDTTWYGHMSGYNFACLYDYVGRFYDVGRIEKRITEEVLGDCSVLVLKTPTGRYSPEEIDTIMRFVERGGGLMLVGEHTNVFGTGVYLNEIARRFGFVFDSDCLFGIDSVFEERWDLPLAPHPIVQRMPHLDFAVSCSVKPGWSDGRAAIRGTGLKNMPADYHASNFYPQVEDRGESRYGAFTQVYALRQGRGRVAAFTDSTIWSNFAAFEPGKSELLMGMTEWLNRSNTTPDLRWWLVGIGAILGLGAIVLALSPATAGGAMGLPLAAALAGWGIAIASVNAVHRRTMPLPEPRRPLTRVVLDQTACSVELPRGGFIGGRPEGFGIFERWILRVGYFISRRSGVEALDGNVVVYLHPDRPVSPEYRQRLVEYVRHGGHILVLDSPDNAKSMANSLLYPFGLSVNRSMSVGGESTAPGFPKIPIPKAHPVTGGQALVTVNNQPVAARITFGKGSVTVIGFGSRFTDYNYGVTGDIVPDPPMRAMYEFQFRLLRLIVEGPAATQPSPDGPFPVEGERRT